MQKRNRILSANKFQFVEVTILLIFWLLLFLSPILLQEQSENTDWDHIKSVWRSFLPYLALFLVNRIILLPYLFFRSRKWIFLFINLILILLLAFTTKPHVDPLPPKENIEAGPGFGRHGRDLAPPPRRLEDGPPPPQFRPPRDRPRGMPYSVNFIIISILVLGFETGLMISFKWMSKEQERSKREKENALSQLAFLRNQVSPHFLMNTLNNIHSLIDFDSEKAKDTIIRLSKLMRHLLYDADVMKIPLEKEFEFIQHYVELMKLRSGERVNIELELPSISPEITIPPLLFTSFIENAFKYGIGARQNTEIKILFSLEKDNLLFNVTNTIVNQERDEQSTGIGIENALKRLDILYSKSYSFDINTLNNVFSVILKIPI